MSKKKSRVGSVFLLFIIASALLYIVYQEQLIPMPLILFAICFTVIVLVCILLLMPSGGEFTVYPLKGKGWRRK